MNPLLKASVRGFEPASKTMEEDPSCASHPPCASHLRMDGTRKRGGMSATEWNAKYPVGTPVLFWPGARQGDGRPSTTRSEAWELGDGTAVVKVKGYAGGIALTHVEPVYGGGA